MSVCVTGFFPHAVRLVFILNVPAGLSLPVLFLSPGPYSFNSRLRRNHDPFISPPGLC